MAQQLSFGYTHTLYTTMYRGTKELYRLSSGGLFFFPNVCGRPFYFSLRRVEEENIMKTDKGDDNRSSVKRLAELSPFNIYSVFFFLLSHRVSVCGGSQINGDRS
jgi:hypothetical protein